MQALDAINNQREVDVFGSTSMPTGAKEDADVTGKANLVHEAPAQSSSESPSEERYKSFKSRRTHHLPCSCTRGNRTHKSKELECTVSIGDADSSKKAQRYLCVECLAFQNQVSIIQFRELVTRLIRKMRH